MPKPSNFKLEHKLCVQEGGGGDFSASPNRSKTVGVIYLNYLIDNTIDTLRTIFFIKPAIRTAFVKHNGLANILQATG